MKKRLALVIAIILILTFVLAGCNMFEIDKERDGDQVVATVKHNGLVAEITKTEFTSYFLQNYQSYANYFEWTVEEAGENFISILARQKMNIILAVQKICEEEGKELNTTKFNAIVKQNVKKGDSKKGFDVYAAYLLSLYPFILLRSFSFHSSLFIYQLYMAFQISSISSPFSQFLILLKSSP